MRYSFALTAFGLFALTGVASADPTLSLADALKLAKQNNGTVHAAYLTYKAFRAASKVAYSALLPSAIASYNRTDQRITGPDNFGPNNFQAGNSSLLTLSYNLWDMGKRRFTYEAANLFATSEQGAALQQLRSTLFEVHKDYLDALRADELYKVQDASQTRANQILEQTKVRVELRDAPAKDILQAQADALNARASLLQARSQRYTSVAALKAVVGWADGDLPALVKPQFAEPEKDIPDLQTLLKMGLTERADLASSRANVKSLDANASSAKLDMYASTSLDAQYQKSFSDIREDTAQLRLSVSVPLYDGHQTRELYNEALYNAESAKASLTQQERTAKSEIESDYYQLTDNRLRDDVAQAALVAAQKNYDASIESEKANVGTLLDVLTAQVSLVTAEQNAVDARYDLLISQVQLRLATGQSIPGETD